MTGRLKGLTIRQLISAILVIIFTAGMLCQITYAQPLSFPGISLQVGSQEEEQGVATVLQLLVLLTVLSLIPSILIMLTSFTRLIVVLSFVRNALSLQQMPPNQVLIGLALFLTVFVMAPVWTVVQQEALEPYLAGEIGEDFAYYFLKSEQIPSAVAVGVLVGTDGSVLASGGYLIQTMPGISSDIVEQVETSTKMTQPVSTMINKGLNPEDILRTVLKSEIKELQRNPVQFQCDCSRDRMERALISLGNEELHTLSHGKNTELVCHFCNSEYLFTPENIDALRKQATNSSLEGDSESS
jgi:uncharacterized membrane protein (DUF485 family)